MADYIGAKHALLTSMGRTALIIALKALEVGYDDDVIVPSFTCDTVIKAVQFTGARIVFADVDPFTFNVKPQKIKESITPKTKAILVIHCYGQPIDLDETLDIAEQYNLPLIEDVAHSIGAEYKHNKVGSFGSFSILSFSKNMKASSGGAVVTNSQGLYEKAEEILADISAMEKEEYRRLPMKYKLLGLGRRWRSHFLSIFSTFNLLKHVTKTIHSMTNEIPMFFGASCENAIEVTRKLKSIDEINSKRIEEARILTELLNSLKLDCISLPLKKRDRKHVYYLYALKVFDKHKFLPELPKLSKYVYWKNPWKCPYGAEAKKLSNQLILLDMRPTLLSEANKIKAGCLWR